MEAYEIFEQSWEEWTGTQNVVACSSGTAALHLALESFQLEPGSQVIVPNYSMVACARAVILAGLEPVFVDCNDDLLLDTETLRYATKNVTKAIMPVHVYGRRCNMGVISRYARSNDVLIIEDMAEAHGVAVHKNTHAACWSFYKNKIVAGEEGGAISFIDEESATIARSLRSLGFTHEHDYTHIPRGHNYRLANCLAERILLSLGMYDLMKHRRKQLVALCDANCPTKYKMPPRQANWVYDIRVPDMTDREQTALVKELQNHGIAARHGFKPLSSQQEFGRYKCISNGKAEKLSSEIIYLPLTPQYVTEEKLVEAFKIIKNFLQPD